MTDEQTLDDLIAIRDTKARALREMQRKRFAAERAAFGAVIAYHDAYDDYSAACDACTAEAQKKTREAKPVTKSYTFKWTTDGENQEGATTEEVKP